MRKFDTVTGWQVAMATREAYFHGRKPVDGRVDAIWFQKLAAGADALLFLRGRVRFYRADKKPTNPPVGSVLVAYGKLNAIALRRSNLPGLLVIPRSRPGGR